MTYGPIQIKVRQSMFYLNQLRTDFCPIISRSTCQINVHSISDIASRRPSTLYRRKDKTMIAFRFDLAFKVRSERVVLQILFPFTFSEDFGILTR